MRFILSHPAVSTIIPGMRKLSNVEANIAASDAEPLPQDLYQQLKRCRWVRKPTPGLSDFVGSDADSPTRQPQNVDD